MFKVTYLGSCWARRNVWTFSRLHFEIVNNMYSLIFKCILQVLELPLFRNGKKS